MPHQWKQRIQDPKRRHAMAVRMKIENGIREFFTSKDFLETRTPLLVPCPGMEPHIRPFKVEGDAYLPTSPEFAMKRLLVGGLERIFQITPAFRNEPRSPHHLPEFTMLEWYCANSNYKAIMKDTEELFLFLAIKLFKKPSLYYQGQEISVAPPWPRLQVRDLFLEHTQIDLVKCNSTQSLAHECIRLGLPVSNSESKPAHSHETCPENLSETWDDLFFKIWLNFIEPKLPKNQAVIIDRYPASQAALSVIDTDPDGSRWAKRFEVFAGGLELGNAFEELTDPVEQRRRFEKDMELRANIYGPSFPKTQLDEEFLEALEEGMPPSGGIAIGVDRMVMLFANEPDIDKTVWIAPHKTS